MLLLVPFLLPFSTFHTHGRGLDASGYHHDRQHASCHCHRIAGQEFSGRKEAEAAIGGQVQTTSPAPTSKLAKVKQAVSLIEGIASVIDGDTLEIHGSRFRLFGIDALESSQLCSRSGRAKRCGQQAALAPLDKIGRQAVTCEPKDTDRYGRTVAVCRLGAEDFNGWMVSQGYALAYRQYASDYVAAEAEAKRRSIGVW